MMLKSGIVCVLLVLVSFVLANPIKVTPPPEELVSIFNLEEPCVHQGGLCLLVDDCESSNLVHLPPRLLCPKQAHLGVVCCYR
ncbi:unnamed protein product [Danaus chrysippus]|uniref:(African queen) hypothetical protein n=1 Tax=Danaus chrysippus TaxID=151541 RepID=A0A8J2Q5M3_9NEOP|nr:unnamed protein product [Danaus chrysippus]